ncbi:hypothetical protein ACOMHN_046549 [Nucella lapillus]
MSFATHLPFPSPAPTLPQSQVSSSPSTPTPNRGCCENGRPVLTDPTTGQSVCSCQYSSALLSYSRLPGLSGSLFSPSSYSPGAPPTPSGYGVGLGAEGSAFYSPLPGEKEQERGDRGASLTPHRTPGDRRTVPQTTGRKKPRYSKRKSSGDIFSETCWVMGSSGVGPRRYLSLPPTPSGSPVTQPQSCIPPSGRGVPFEVEPSAQSGWK